MSRLPLSVCLIARNEATVIRRCLESVVDLAGEIIVVDTGSTDETARIARAFGARVFPFRWIDDFAAARNRALEEVTQPWIMMLDADQWLPPASRQHLQQHLLRLPPNAVVTCHRDVQDLDLAGDQVIIWPTYTQARYVGRVHESIRFPADMHWIHWRDLRLPSQRPDYDQAASEARVAYYGRLMAEEAAAGQPRAELLMSYGSLRLAQGDHEAGMALLEEVLRHPEAGSSLKAAAAYRLTVAQANVGRLADAFTLAKALCAKSPDFLDAHFLAGMYAGALGQPQEALGYFSRALRLHRFKARQYIHYAEHDPARIIEACARLFHQLGDEVSEQACQAALAGQLDHGLREELWRRLQTGEGEQAFRWYLLFFAPLAQNPAAVWPQADPAAAAILQAELWAFLDRNGLVNHQAEQLLEATATAYPQDPLSAVALARHLIATGRPEQAYQWLQTAVARGDASGETQLNLGHLAMDLGHLTEAATAFQAARQVPGTAQAAEAGLTSLGLPV